MKITKLAIKNYRSCVEAEFSPNENLSVLIGPNGSGKTTVLSAIRLLPALCFARGRPESQEEFGASLAELRVTYDVDGTAVNHFAELGIATNEKNLDEIFSVREYWTIPSIVGSRRRISLPSAFIGDYAEREGFIRFRSHSARRDLWFPHFEAGGTEDMALPILTKVVQFLRRMSYYSASQFTNPTNSPISFEVESDARRRVGISITGHKKLLFDLYQEYRDRSDVFQEFISIVGPEGIGLVDSMDFEEIKTSSSSYRVMTGGKVVRGEKTNLLVVPRFEIAGNMLSPSQLSEGTFKTLALVFYLVADKSTILMVEEPEVCVHHGLLLSIVDLIKTYSRHKQILMSTHSDLVLDRLDIENVFAVNRTKSNGTKVSPIHRGLKAKELSALKEYLEREGGLGEYWKHGGLGNG